jgi:purine nucleosidase
VDRSENNKMAEFNRVILDTDIGSDIDDALALLLLLHLPQAELLGVTTVYGKVELRARIAKKIVSLANRRVPIAAGVGLPLRPAFPVWHTGIEGVGMLDEAELAADWSPDPIAPRATAFIVEQVMGYPREVTLIGIGALTNIAMALDDEPRLADMAKQLVFMGAGVTYPDVVPDDLVPQQVYWAKRSHNVGCDVEAARRVFASRLPIRVLTNDVTTQVWWDGETVQQLIHASAPAESAAVGKLLHQWLLYRTRTFGRPITGTCPHDPLTVAEALQPGRFVDYLCGHLRILDDGSTNFHLDPNGPHEVGVRVRTAQFLAWMTPRLSVPRPCHPC